MNFLLKLCKSKAGLASFQRRHFHLDLTPEQVEIQNLARQFTKDHIIPKASHHDQTGEYPTDILKQAWRLGLLNNHIPSDYGGMNLSALPGTLIAEELAYGCAGIWTAAEGNNLAEAPVILGASDEIKKKFLGRMIEEPLMAAYCVTEPSAGSDVSGITTTARKVGNEWILNGTKMWITNGSVANWYFVLAKALESSSAPEGKTRNDTQKASFVAFIVEREGTKGLTVGKKEINMGQRASDTRQVIFEEVKVPDTQRIGGIGEGFKLAMKAFDMTRPVIGAGALGLARRAFHEAVQYALERKTMGQAIIHHQSVANLIAAMATSIEASSGLIRKAAYEADQGRRNTLYASMAKWKASETAVFCASTAVQVFGGMGYNTEGPVEKLYRDAKLFEIYEGTSQIQSLIISRILSEQVSKQGVDSLR